MERAFAGAWADQDSLGRPGFYGHAGAGGADAETDAVALVYVEGLS
jgi:hypothetical protein